MDYIQGQNLETLRQGQPEWRFSLPLIVALMAPIVDALIYLHRMLKIWIAPHVIATSVMLALLIVHIVQAVFFNVR